MANSGFSINSVIEDALQVIKAPAEFYRRMPHSGGYGEPIIFLVVMAAVAGLILTIVALSGTGVSGVLSFGLAAVIIFPVFAVIGSFIGAAVMFVIWKLMGSEKSYETAYRCIAYASAIYPIYAILGLIPYAGSIVYIIWGMYLMIMASIEVHGFESRKAYTVFGVIGLILVVINVNGEINARRSQAYMDQAMQGMENKSPEEIGKMVGEFMKGVQDAQQQQ